LLKSIQRVCEIFADQDVVTVALHR
jgi:hypothetical protein